jgi:hypothetical protein
LWLLVGIELNFWGVRKPAREPGAGVSSEILGFLEEMEPFFGCNLMEKLQGNKISMNV